MGAESDVKTAKKKVFYVMGSLINLLGLGVLLYWVFADSSGFAASRRKGEVKKVIPGYVFVDGTSAVGTTDENFICATLDWWPPEKCDYGTCSWGKASLLNLVSAFFPVPIHPSGWKQ